MDFQTFKTEVNRLRKAGGWYQLVKTVDGKSVRLKGYRTWLQIYDVEGVRHGNNCDQSVKQFNIDLEKPFKYEVYDEP